MCVQDFIRAYAAYTTADKKLVELDNIFRLVTTEEGVGNWTRVDTLQFLEEKGLTGSGVPVGVGSSSKGDRLKQYILACVTAFTWSQKISHSTMKDLLKLWGGLPKHVPSPHKLINTPSSDEKWENSFADLSEFYSQYAREHLTQVGHQLLDALASIRHHEGTQRHMDEQGAGLRRSGVKIFVDNRYLFSHCCPHMCIVFS